MTCSVNARSQKTTSRVWLIVFCGQVWKRCHNGQPRLAAFLERRGFITPPDSVLLPGREQDTLALL